MPDNVSRADNYGPEVRDCRPIYRLGRKEPVACYLGNRVFFAADEIANANRPSMHPDDEAVDRFALVMKTKMAKKRDQGYGGWDNRDICSADDLLRMLREHVEKGDMVDVGNLAMMLWNRAEALAAE